MKVENAETFYHVSRLFTSKNILVYKEISLVDIIKEIVKNYCLWLCE